jgi:hypothetical protein
MGTTLAALPARHLLSRFLPVMTFLLALAFVGPGGGHADAVLRWGGQPKIVIATQTGLLVGTALLVTVLTDGSGDALLRLLSGASRFWRRAVGRPCFAEGRRNHLRRMARLDSDPDAHAALEAGYPSPVLQEEVSPTTLGNVLRSAELYPRSRYGMDVAVVWPRLYRVLPDRTAGEVAAARGELELRVHVAGLAALFAVVAGAWALVSSTEAWRFPLYFGAGAVLALLAYRSAVGAAALFGLHLRTAVDVHRGELLERLGAAPRPDDPALWFDLAQFWDRGIPVGAAAPEPAPAPSDPSAEPPRRRPVPVLPLTSWYLLLTVTVGVLGTWATTVL